ncbi:MAG: hypothetical protein Kilf2KO_31760 [Rhodospirillales bacterium]
MDSAFTILTPEAFRRTPWKNGLGVTDQIASHGDAQGLLWRLSLAEVSSDGPFSRFEGLERLLTVVEGPGMDLLGPEGGLAAEPERPLAFSGDLPLEGRLRGAPVRNLNLIYDPRRLRASGACLRPAGRLTAPGPLCLLYLLSGEVTGAGGSPVAAGSAVIVRSWAQSLATTKNTALICLTLTALNDASAP